MPAQHMPQPALCKTRPLVDSSATVHCRFGCAASTCRVHDYPSSTAVPAVASSGALPDSDNATAQLSSAALAGAAGADAALTSTAATALGPSSLSRSAPPLLALPLRDPPLRSRLRSRLRPCLRLGVGSDLPSFSRLRSRLALQFRHSDFSSPWLMAAPRHIAVRRCTCTAASREA